MDLRIFSNVGVKEGYVPPLTLFALGIDNGNIKKEEGLDAPKLMQLVMLLLLYANEMVIFTYDVIAMQSLLGVD